MTFTNYGNEYKFEAIQKRRHHARQTITYQRMKKNGEWGKVRTEELRYYNTPKEAVAAWNELNPETKFRLA